MINVFQPALGREELAAVQEVFASNWVGKGPKTTQFEAAFAAHIGVDTGLMQSVNSCTEGLFQAMNVLEISAGDEVILPTISFVGAANAVMACGAKPVFCDVDSRTLNPTAADIEQVITPRTKAVILLHYGGVPCDMDTICPLLAHHSVALIEDCAISVASRYRGLSCGTFGEIAVWSFDAMKILVTGDGGMLYCRNPELAERAKRLLYLGLENESGYSSEAATRWWEFEVLCTGRNAGMNDFTAAIGLVQLQKLAGSIARRRVIAERYDCELRTCHWLQVPPTIPTTICSSYYFYWVQMAPEIRDRLAHRLRAQGIYTTFRYHPLHRVNYYSAPQMFPGADKAADTTLCLPLHQSLTADDLTQIIGAIRCFAKDL